MKNINSLKYSDSVTANYLLIHIVGLSIHVHSITRYISTYFTWVDYPVVAGVCFYRFQVSHFLVDVVVVVWKTCHQIMWEQQQKLMNTKLVMIVRVYFIWYLLPDRLKIVPAKKEKLSTWNNKNWGMKNSVFMHTLL